MFEITIDTRYQPRPALALNGPNPVYEMLQAYASFLTYRKMVLSICRGLEDIPCGSDSLWRQIMAKNAWAPRVDCATECQSQPISAVFPPRDGTQCISFVG